MKIKLLRAVKKHGVKGDEVEVPTFLGEAWVAAGYAEAVKEVAKKSVKKSTSKVETAEAVKAEVEER